MEHIMRKARIAAALFVGITSIAAVADARAIRLDGEIITNKTYIGDVGDVNDPDEDHRGRTGDIDICNAGAARGIDGGGNYSADINDDDCFG
jgi:hypothetical protein